MSIALAFTPRGIYRNALLSAALMLCVMSVPSIAVGIEPKPFGIESFSTQTTETTPGGDNEPYLFTQAAGHPDALTTSIQFATEETEAGQVFAAGDPRNVTIDLPVGMVANPQTVAHCSGQNEQCPTDSQVGVFVLRFVGGEQRLSVLGAIFEMTPYPGQPAELGLEVPLLGRVLLTAHLVRTPQGYSLALVGRGLPVPNLSGIVENAPMLHLASMETTLWGVPEDPVHDPQRGLSCLGLIGMNQWSCTGGGLLSGEEATPFLTMPSTCSGVGEATTVWVDSWQNPTSYVQAQSTLPPMAYCDRLPFHPEISVRPETVGVDRAVGVSVAVKVPQVEGASALVATPPLRAATITLPQGLSINPSVGDGQKACEPTGPTGFNIPTGLNAAGEALQPEEVGIGEEIPPEGPTEPELAPGHCPEASTVGVAEATTPFLPRPIKGRVYLATPRCGGARPCSDANAVDGTLYHLYIELGGKNGERNEGVVIKLEATVQANPATGELTVRLTEAPQLQLDELNLRLSGGSRALLANPPRCGTATTTSDIQPWSTPYTPDASPSDYYVVTGCPSAPVLAPRVVAGSVDATAGAFSPFTFTVTRQEGEPYLSQLQLHAPAGLSAVLSSVPLCAEALANAGTCPEGSRIGSSIVTVGSGSPLSMPGTMYLTGPYEGAPFGLSIVTHAVAGPLDLGSVVIRARIDIDPHTAALIVTSDQFPQIVLGVPLRLRRITLNIDRPNFTMNPTDCDAQVITATVAGAEGGAAGATNPFAVGGCRYLSFKPTVRASMAGKTTYASGAGLDLKLSFPKEEAGIGANLARMKVALPPQLPPRLTTLQGACRGSTFDVNPSACPPTSIVGIAKARTSVLSTQLTGPVYLVSRGPNVFPSPVMVMQGEGVTLELPGSTTVHDKGVSVTFNTIPDIPVQSMEIYLPPGAHSLLSANTKLCALGKLVTVSRSVTQRVGSRTVTRRVRVRERVVRLPMPTSLVAQNGLVLHRGTKIEVLGCGGGGVVNARTR
ncbi:MAG: hypothetical protein ACRDJ3_05405 [Solirubrobacteraceae bacterium]